MKRRFIFLFVTIIVSYVPVIAQNVSLSGKWSIATDLQEKGVELDWHEEFSPNSGGLVTGWDAVTVPHSYTLDSRLNITGKVWYRRSFKLPEGISEKVCRIHFSSVFYKARVWVNGVYLGTHEGGYTPFTYDITRAAKPGTNHISVEVDNRWSDNTIPAARLGTRPSEQVYPWYDYGGITGDVQLQITGKIFITKQKVEPVIDLKKNTAVINIQTWANLYTGSNQPVTAEGFIAFADNPGVPLSAFPPVTIDGAPYMENLMRQKISLKAEQLRLWDFDHPVLYTLTTIVKSGSHSDTFRVRTGLRTINTAGGKLLLNGQPVRLGGANRHRDYPGYGSLDPKQIVETDMGLMKTGNMLLTRIHHYPANETLLDWADENGMLIIEEIPVWQWSDAQLIDPMMQAKAMIQAREMVERDWNRPSVIGWSGGNEYSTWTPEGDSYTKFITDFFRNLDNTRLATVVSHAPATRPENIAPAHNTFRHCDIICINYYIESDLDKHLERIHERFPEKPVFITEFGKLSLQTNEEERINNLKYYLNTIRKYPFVAGLSWWTINDYRSRYPGTNQDGYRNFGLVTEERKELDTYFAAQKEFCLLIAEKDKSTLRLTARNDFPSFIVRDYKIRIVKGNEVIKEVPVPSLSPGATSTFELPELLSDGNKVEILNPGGFVVYEIK